MLTKSVSDIVVLCLVEKIANDKNLITNVIFAYKATRRLISKLKATVELETRHLHSMC